MDQQAIDKVYQQIHQTCKDIGFFYITGHGVEQSTMDLLFKKNTILVWNRLRIIVSMLGSRGVPSLQGFSNAIRASVNDTRII